ncbi:hypothetical protein SMMN14_02958 [Sphaerulina musiva]
MQMITMITLLLPLAMAAPTPISEPALQPMAEPIKRSPAAIEAVEPVEARSEAELDETDEQYKLYVYTTFE